MSFDHAHGPERPIITIPMMLDGLRVDDRETREAAAYLLARSAAAGLRARGVSEADAAKVAGVLLPLLEQAVEGDDLAVDEVENLIGTGSRRHDWN